MFAKKLFKADGTTVDINEEITLEAAQGYVGGYIEVVRSLGKELLVNEDGMSMELPRNAWASDLCGRQIVGDVLLIKTGSMT